MKSQKQSLSAIDTLVLAFATIWFVSVVITLIA
jgi:hypothetical protein